MNFKKIIKNHSKKFIFFLMILSVVTVILGVGLGPVRINFFTVWDIIVSKLFSRSLENFEINTVKIVWNLRLPRVIIGFIVGGGLALAGVAIQAFTKNPLAEPYILGVSSGASAGAVMVALNGTLISVLGNLALPVGAFLGSIIALIGVYGIARTKDGVVPIRLILVGTAVSSMFMAITNFLVFNAKSDSGVRNAMFWMMGSLAGSKWKFIPIPLIILVIATVIFMILSRTMNTMLLGENTSVILGMNIKLTRKILIIISSLLAGSIVSISGSIGFVGLIIPHIVRNLLGSDHHKVIPASILLGGNFIILSDIAARLLVAPQELPIGIVTSFLGAPFFIYLIKKNKYTFGG